jgi:hypothetical protein
MAGSRTTRAGTKRTAVRRRAVGTRDRIIAHLSRVDEIADSAGMASTRLAEAVGYPGSSVAFAQLLSGMERDGLIEREVRGKRTYRICLADGAIRAGMRHAATHAVRGDAAGSAVPSEVSADAVAAAAAGMTAPGDPRSAGISGLDYDELARRLLVQVLRRLAATPSDLEQTVAGLERELATAWTRHGTLSAENIQLREQLLQTQRDLDLARQRNRRIAVADELDSAEVVVLERLLTSGEGGDIGQPPATASERALAAAANHAASARAASARAPSAQAASAQAAQALAMVPGGFDVVPDGALRPRGVDAAALDGGGHASDKRAGRYDEAFGH